jgi:hypothetical protein
MDELGRGHPPDEEALRLSKPNPLGKTPPSARVDGVRQGIGDQFLLALGTSALAASVLYMTHISAFNRGVKYGREHPEDAGKVVKPDDTNLEAKKILAEPQLPVLENVDVPPPEDVKPVVDDLENCGGRNDQ